MASIKCHPHLRAHAGKGEQYMQKIDGQDTVVGMGDYPNVSTRNRSLRCRVQITTSTFYSCTSQGECSEQTEDFYLNLCNYHAS